MQNRFEVAPRAGIVEYQLPQSAPVERALAVDDPGAKALDHLGEPRCARLDDAPGRHIGVDDGNAKIRESLGNRALAAGNAPGEADAQAAWHG